MNINFNNAIKADIKKSSEAVIDDAVSRLRNVIDFGMSEVDAEKLREEFEPKITAKLESGRRLSQKELNYLRKYNPVMYAHAMRIEAKRKGVEERLKHASSKQEVQEIQDEAIASVGEKDPVRKYIIAAIEETMKAFKETDAYKKLPDTDEERKQKIKNNKLRNGEEEEDDTKGLRISYEIKAGTYQIAYQTNVSEVYENQA